MTTVSSTPAPRKRRRGNNGLYKDKRGRFVLDVIVRGHRMRRNYGLISAAVAKTVAMRDTQTFREAILTTGAPPAPPQVTDLTLNAAFAKYEQVAFQDLRPRTRVLYGHLLKPLRKHLGDLRLGALSPLDVERYRKTRTQPAPGRRGTGTTVCNREIGLLSAIIGRCQTWGLTTRADNPCKGIRRFKERSRDRVLDYDEEARLFAALPVALHPVTRLALECGARLQSELLSLRWDALDLDRQQVTIRAEFAKNGKSRVLPLGDAMTATLRTLQATATSELVFPAALGGHQHHFSMQYSKAVRKAKLVGVTIHCLRHTWASRLAESSGDLLLLKELGGWSSLSMVQRYAHLREGRGAEAIRKMLADRERALSPAATPRPMSRAPRNA